MTNQKEVVSVEVQKLNALVSHLMNCEEKLLTGQHESAGIQLSISLSLLLRIVVAKNNVSPECEFYSQLIESLMSRDLRTHEWHKLRKQRELEEINDSEAQS